MKILYKCDKKMKTIQTARCAGIILIGCLLLAGGTVAAAGIQVYMGDIVTLQGYSYGSPTVYLFLTGPNLPVNGVALDNINARADEGHFTEVDVDSNDHWIYHWATNSVGGKLDGGAYTIWVVDSPTDRSHLDGTSYRTITVGLDTPGITISTPVTPLVPGTMDLSSSPNETSVVVNNAYKGKTPLTLGGLTPGTYNVTFSRFGYYPFSTPVKVESGSVSDVVASLEQQTGGLLINTSPAGARVMIDGTDAGISPLTITSLTTGNHTLNVSAAGYTSQELPVHVSANQTRTINLELVPVSPFSDLWVAVLGLAIILAGVIGVLLIVKHRSRHH
jgi:hypothetical protein